MIKNIVFDIGNVLADFRWKEYMIEKGLDGPTIKRVMAASIMSPDWDLFDMGMFDDDEALRRFASYDPELQPVLERVYRRIDGMIVPFNYATDWIKSLKDRGFSIYYLSNYSRKAYEECKESLEFMKYADGGVMSFQEHVLKPDPAIYQRLLDKYNLKAEESVFLDDTQKNVDAALQLGFKAFTFTTKEQADIDIESVC
ncbi:MAG: HAD family phosphatase [Lachnospiraceae bacterium]|nr:HAD family phosphatase [Lachnospiraceae bacterium]